MKADSLRRRILQGLLGVRPGATTASSPSARTGHSLTRRVLAGLTGVQLPDHTPLKQRPDRAVSPSATSPDLALDLVAAGPRRGWGPIIAFAVVCAVVVGDSMITGTFDRPHEPGQTSPPPSGRPLTERRTFTVQGNNDAALKNQIRLKTQKWAGHEAALVQTFGGGPGGVAYAHRVNSLLHDARPEMFHRDVATDDFLNLSSHAETAEIWIYFWAGPDGQL